MSVLKSALVQSAEQQIANVSNAINQCNDAYRAITSQISDCSSWQGAGGAATKKKLEEIQKSLNTIKNSLGSVLKKMTAELEAYKKIAI